MATLKKPASTAKKPGTALVPWEAAMAVAAKKQAKAEKVFGSFKAISTKGGMLAIDEKPIKGNSLNVVVLCSVHENQFYEGAYNPAQSVPPSCYAFGDQEADEPEAEMAPHAEVETEKRQADKCKDCWANKMASADQGKGKACKNVRRLAVVTEDALESAEALAEAEVRMIKVPVTSTTNWAKYVNNTCSEELNRPAWGVVTKLSLTPDAKTQFKMLFEFSELVTFDQDLYDAMQKRIAELKPTMVSAYPKMEEQAAPPARGGRAAPGKQAAAAPRKPLPRTVPIVPVKGAAAKRPSKY